MEVHDNRNIEPSNFNVIKTICILLAIDDNFSIHTSFILQYKHTVADAKNFIVANNITHVPPH